MPSADFCLPIPARCRAGSTWQEDGSPRVMRATFLLIPAAYTSMPSVRRVSGFEDSGLLTQHDRLACDLCSSGQHFACGFLRIPSRDGHPCRPASNSPCGPAEDFHLQVTRQAPHLPGWCSRTTRPAGRTKKKGGPAVAPPVCGININIVENTSEFCTPYRTILRFPKQESPWQSIYRGTTGVRSISNGFPGALPTSQEHPNSSRYTYCHRGDGIQE